MKILAIETSCDETAIAVLSFSGKKTTPHIRILASILSSQAALHTPFGGVVPNLANREHQRNLPILLLKVLRETEDSISNFKFQISKKTKKIEKIFEREPELLAHFKKNILPLAAPKIDALAVTNGPGLAPALWVGVNFARALSILWDIPLIPVNHMEGHLFSALLRKSGKKNDQFQISNFKFPALALLVSGGHTELVLMHGFGKYKIIGETLDDAAGEAFDKVARMLGLGYPGGPAISATAEIKSFPPKADPSRTEKFKVALPRPMMHSKDFNFSFSGLKTAVLYLTKNLGAAKTKKYTPLIAKEFQQAVVDVLVAKTIHACRTHKVKTLLLGGGVAANKLLRTTLTRETKKIKIPLLVPDFSLTGDNAIMIALAAYLTGTKKAWTRIHAQANRSFS